MRPEPDRLSNVVKWVEYADQDLQLAKHALGMMEPCPYRLVAYHAQQCGEKYLKAFLVWRGVDFPRTHNISTLLELCDPQTGWLTTLIDAERLTPYAVLARYPGEDEPVKRDEAHQAIQWAEQIRRMVRKALCETGLPELADMDP